MYGICNIVLTLLNYLWFILHRNQRDWTVPLCTISSYAILDLLDVSEVKKNIEMCSLLLLCDCKQSEKGGRRILLGDNTGGEAFMLQLIRFTFVGVWISTGLHCTK